MECMMEGRRVRMRTATWFAAVILELAPCFTAYNVLCGLHLGA